MKNRLQKKNITEEPTNQTISEEPTNGSIVNEIQGNITEEINQTQNFTSNETLENFTISNETIFNITNDSNFMNINSPIFINSFDGNVNLYRNQINYSSSAFYVVSTMSNKLVVRDNNFYRGTSVGIFVGGEVTNGVDII